MCGLRSLPIPSAWISTRKGVPNLGSVTYAKKARLRHHPGNTALPAPTASPSAAWGLLSAMVIMSPNIWVPNDHDRAGAQRSEP